MPHELEYSYRLVRQDTDYATRTPRKPFGGLAGAGGGGVFAGGPGTGGFMPSDLAAAAAGTPSNLGKVGDAGAYIITLISARS